MPRNSPAVVEDDATNRERLIGVLPSRKPLAI